MKSFRLTYTSILLASWTAVASTQILSCTDLGCPPLGPFCSCNVQEQTLTAIGVTTFATELTTDPFSWTVGFAPAAPAAQGQQKLPDKRVFYLGQPHTPNLYDAANVQACAIFFDGAASDLAFSVSQAAVGDLRSNGSCEDAMTEACVVDLKAQARGVAAQSNSSGLTCQNLADQLRTSPPASCTVVQNDWGNVVAYDISGPQSPSPVPADQLECNPTINDNYTVTEIHSTNSSTSVKTFLAITPVLTIISFANDTSNQDVYTNLTCLKPVLNAEMFENTFQSGTARLHGRMSLLLLAFLPLILL